MRRFANVMRVDEDEIEGNCERRQKVEENIHVAPRQPMNAVDAPSLVRFVCMCANECIIFLISGGIAIVLRSEPRFDFFFLLLLQVKMRPASASSIFCASAHFFFRLRPFPTRFNMAFDYIMPYYAYDRQRNINANVCMCEYFSVAPM